MTSPDRAMIWTDRAERFVAPSGKPVHVNTDASRWFLVDASPHRLAAAARQVCHDNSRHIAMHWKQQCLDCPDTGDVEDARRWIERLVNTVPRQTRYAEHAPVLLLAALRLQGVLIWPALIRTLAHPVPWVAPKRTLVLGEAKFTPFERSLVPSAAHYGPPVRAGFMALSPAWRADDLSAEAILALTSTIVEHTLPEARKDTLMLALARAVEGRKLTNGFEIQVAEDAERILREVERRGPQSLRYGVAATRPDAEPWVDWFAVLSEQVKLKRGGVQDAAHRRLLDYLASLGGVIPTPSEIDRDLHILGPKGLLNWLQGFNHSRSEIYSTYLHFLNLLFEAMCDEGEMEANPLRSSDLPPSIKARGKSTKALIPKEIECLIRDVVTELFDHAFAQAAGLSAQEWRPAGVVPSFVKPGDDELLPPTILLPGLFRQLGATVRGRDGTIRHILNPVLPVIVRWLCDVPNRGVEVRQADSGEGDEFVPELSLIIREGGASTVEAVRKRNAHPLATVGRAKGAIRKMNDGARDFVGLYATINKSQRGGHRDGKDRGREIPWEDPGVLMALQGVREWQGRFNPADRMMSRDELVDPLAQPSDGLRGKLDRYVFLFRYLQDRNLSGRLEPCTYILLHLFFMNVLDEVEARLKVRRSKQAGSAGEIVPKIILARHKDKRAMRCAYTLHGLRVTRLSELAAIGVPLWILSEVLAGHTDIMMTLRYIKSPEGTVFDVLSAARDSIASNALRSVAIKASLMSETDLATRYVRDLAAGAGTGNQIAGFWRVSSDGICPNGGTLCHEGGPTRDGGKLHMPVEGGAQNCSLCRFNLTGPEFVPGQVLWINATIHKVRRQAKGLQTLWGQRRAATGYSSIASLDERIARVEAEIDLTVRGLHSRIIRLEKSLALARLDEGDGARKDGVPAIGSLLITRMEPGDVRAALRETSELGMLDQVSRIAALIPEADVSDAPIERNRIVDQLLQENGIEPFLYRLRGQQAELAGDALMDGIRARAPGGFPAQDYVDQLARGERGLLRADLPGIEAEVSAAVGRPIKLSLTASGPARPPLLEAAE